MGAELSVINDLEETCTVEVWTLGFIILENSGSVLPGKTLTLYDAATWYDLRFKIWRLGVQDVQEQRVFLGSTTTTFYLSAIFGADPTKPPPARLPPTVGEKGFYSKEDTAATILAGSDLKIYLDAGGEPGDSIETMVAFAKEKVLHKSPVESDTITIAA